LFSPQLAGDLNKYTFNTSLNFCFG